ncbi:MAG: DAK2 domain-containing protein [Ruminococcaceae bacterium]|nr:DAK2 domain-containing protein [Oscillospiraceae bacterium]
MMEITRLDGFLWADMVAAGARNLHAHMEEVNDLNVFPIPDGDTGENMMLTMQGSVKAAKHVDGTLWDAATKISDGMLLGARGNSGVILSQFFAGIAQGFGRYESADVHTLEKAIACGVGCAFESVMTPTEGTILTVMRDAGYYAGNCDCQTPGAYFCAFLEEAKRSLDRTPELLPILKEAGVVDSGGAGLLYIVEGMYASLCGETVGEEPALPTASLQAVDPDLFDENSVMEFGYCTELLLRLQNCKVDTEHFDADVITEFLNTVGDSVVLVKNGTVVKLHVHTMTPSRVLEFCQQYGEFLTVKIENMMLQHNGTVKKESPVPPAEAPVTQRQPFSVVTVATGEGIKRTFCEMGADEVICGGQTMNPSAKDFLQAFDRVNADVVFVLPNNGNVLLAARQAAQLYRKSDVRVIPTHSIGDGYAVLSMLDFDSGDPDAIEAEMNGAMEGVVTAEISRSIRDAEMNGVRVRKDDYIGIAGKKILSAGTDREEVTCRTADTLALEEHALLLLIRGNGVTEEDSAPIVSYLHKKYPLAEICEADGGQDIYDYILVAE